MKIWIRYFLGIAAGVAIGLFLEDIEAGALIWERLAGIVVNIGLYMLIPLAFFGTAVSVHDLRENKRTIATLSKALVAIVVATIIAVGLGLFAVLFLSPGPLPVILEQPPIPDSPTIFAVLVEAFPENAFRSLIFGSESLIGAVVFAALIGATVASDNRFASLLEDVIDGLARVFYRINAGIVHLLGIGLIALVTDLVISVRELGDISFFGPLILVASVAAVVLTIGVYPLFIYLAGGRWNPAPWILAMLPAAFAALASGNSYFAGGTLSRVVHENLGVKRQIGGFIVPFTLLFSRAGSAMVASLSFILVLNSYSGLSVGMAEIGWIAGTSVVLSFVLVGVPGSGVIVLLGMLSAGYGAGLEEAFLILRPAGALLLAIAAYGDVMTAGAIVRIVAGSEYRQRIETEVSDFV